MLSFVLFLFFKNHYFVFLFILKKNHCMLAKREKLKGKHVWKSKTNKKMLRVSKTFVWVACYSNCLCSKVHFLWKESKLKKIILTPCAIKLSFIRHGFCHSQRVCVLFQAYIFKCVKTDYGPRLCALIQDTSRMLNLMHALLDVSINESD